MLEIINNYEAELSDINVAILKKLGGGGQAKVFLCRIRDEKPSVKYATKIREAFNNNALSNIAFKETYNEYMLAKNLDHPNIIKYKYFVKQGNDEVD